MAPTTKSLIVVAQVIIDSSGGLGFTQIGTDIILVSNPLDVIFNFIEFVSFSHYLLQPLEEWTYTTSRIVSSSTNLTWNSGITFYDGYFYLIGLGNSNAYLARITYA